MPNLLQVAGNRPCNFFHPPAALLFIGRMDAPEERAESSKGKLAPCQSEAKELRKAEWGEGTESYRQRDIGADVTQGSRAGGCNAASQIAPDRSSD